MSNFENPIVLLKQKNVNLQGVGTFVPQMAPYHLVLTTKKYYILLNLDRVNPAHSPPSALFHRHSPTPHSRSREKIPFSGNSRNEWQIEI